MSNGDRAHGVHFVGTIPLNDTAEVLGTVGATIGDRVRRLPDGETGERKDWVWIQVPRAQRHPDLEPTAVEVPGVGEMTLMSPREGVTPEKLDMGDLGYADFAAKSYATFRSLKDSGLIAEHVRFQVNLPTPLAATALIARPDAAPALEPAYTRAMLHELDRIAAHVPHHELAVQWDTCFELLFAEGWQDVPPWFDDILGGIRDRMSTLGGAVPADVQLGFHLCYGDFQHQRQVDLDDATTLVRLANLLATEVPRPIDFLHLPVREDTDPATYLAPLRELRLDDRTDLYLGLITDGDGLEGAMNRIRAARRHVASFGIATECGMGRREPSAVQPLLAIHRDATEPGVAGPNN